MSKLEEDEWPDRFFEWLAGRMGLRMPPDPLKLPWSLAKGGEPGGCL